MSPGVNVYANEASFMKHTTGEENQWEPMEAGPISGVEGVPREAVPEVDMCFCQACERLMASRQRGKAPPG